jgi:hypothetical protein
MMRGLVPTYMCAEGLVIFSFYSEIEGLPKKMKESRGLGVAVCFLQPQIGLRRGSAEV